MRSAKEWVFFDFDGPRDALDILVALLGDAGLRGTEEIAGGERLRVFVDSPSDRDILEARIATACERSGARRVASGTQPREDWLTEWKRHFRPVQASPHVVVCPPWEIPRALPGNHVVVIQPEMAFGTGTHASTQLCLSLLEEIIVPGDTVLDVGCGSGILAIAAVKLGARAALAIDIDPEAVENARRNTQLNGLRRSIRVLLGDFSTVAVAPASVVICNEIAPNLVTLLPRLREAVFAPRGQRPGALILSGIDALHADFARAAFPAAGLTIDREAASGEWTAFVARVGVSD